MNSPILQLLVLAGIAIFLILRLRSVLGTREGFEKPTLPREEKTRKVGRTEFEVIEQQQMGPTEFWCAAASYNEVRQNRSETLPIYISKPRGPAVTQRGAKGVVFTLDPAGLPVQENRLTVTVNERGATLKSVQARRFCRDAFTRSTK